MLIYKITNKINGKMYVGQTVQDLKKRWNSHCAKNNGCIRLHNSIKKYGKENFEVKVLVRCSSIEEMNHRESYYIKLLNALSPNGYNLTTGGKNKRLSEETKEKISNSNKGKKRSPYTKETRLKMSESRMGRRLSKETKEKISESSIGKILSEETKEKIGDAHRGKFVSEETRLKMSNSNKDKKRPHSAEWCENQRLIMTGRKHTKESKLKVSISKQKKIICNETEIVYDSITKAAIQLGCHRDSIQRVLRGKNNTCKGLTFSYCEVSNE